MINNIARIKASIYRYFDQNRSTYRLYIEGQDIDMGDKGVIPAFGVEEDATKIPSWAEIRITGPRIKFIHGKIQYDVDVNIMCSTRNINSIYFADGMASFFTRVANSPIPVTDEEATQLGCLFLRKDEPHQLETVQWGKVQVNEITVMQASVEAFYRMEL